MPQPVDMQTEIARATIAERIQDAMGRSNLAALQRAQLESEEVRIVKELQVNETQETQSGKVDADGEQKNKRSNRRTRKNRGSVEKSARLRPRHSNDDDHQLDVRI